MTINKKQRHQIYIPYYLKPLKYTYTGKSAEGK